MNRHVNQCVDTEHVARSSLLCGSATAHLAIVAQSNTQGGSMTGSAVDIVTNFLQNLGNPKVVQSLVATDAVYVSLNQDNPELKQILPWAGTHHGPSSFTDALGTMFIWWANEQFDPTDIVGDDDRAAVFGTFRYRSHTLDKVVTSPFAILIRVADGLITYLQFMEDTYATAASFRSAGSWTVHGDPSGQQLKVPSN
jgi:uncharacterized protein